MKKFTIIILMFLLSFILAACGRGNTEMLNNPYEGIDWDHIHFVKANLHTHTTNSDGNYLPHEVIDMYHEAGYGALALTDHDDRALHHHITYPWDYLADYHDDWENRNPESLGMIAISGNEFSRKHHIAALFTNLDPEPGWSEKEMFEQLAKEADSFGFLAHPGRYWRSHLADDEGEYSTNWYLDMVQSFDPDVMPGIEIANQDDRYDLDRVLWDRLLLEIMPNRPLWGVAVDDYHIGHIGYSYTSHLLEDPLDKDAFRDTLLNGRFFSTTSMRVDRATPIIESVIVDEEKQTITIQSPNADLIRWVSGVDEHNLSLIVGEGAEFYYGDLDSPYVRAEVVINPDSMASRAITFTQPFALGQKE